MCTYRNDHECNVNKKATAAVPGSGPPSLAGSELPVTESEQDRRIRDQARAAERAAVGTPPGPNDAGQEYLRQMTADPLGPVRIGNFVFGSIDEVNGQG